MAITVTPTWNRSSDLNEKGERTYTLTYYVETDDPEIGAGVVREAVGWVRGEPYQTSTEFDNGAFCVGINASCKDDDGLGWTVTVNFGPPPQGQDSPTENPLNQPSQVAWSFAQFERPVDKTVDGEAIVNTAGDPFANEILRDDSRPVLAFTRNEASFNASLAYSYRDTVNSDPFMGAAPGQVKVSNISGARQFDPNFGFYWTVSYEFMFSADGFEKKIVSAGLREKNDQGKPANILVQGQPINDPALLDKKGKQLKPGAPPHIQEFKIYNETSFSAFNLE